MRGLKLSLMGIVIVLWVLVLFELASAADFYYQTGKVLPDQSVCTDAYADTGLARDAIDWPMLTSTSYINSHSLAYWYDQGLLDLEYKENQSECTNWTALGYANQEAKLLISYGTCTDMQVAIYYKSSTGEIGICIPFNTGCGVSLDAADSCFGTSPYVPPETDSDGDGLSDDNDPLPNDSRGFVWKIIAKIYDQQGNLYKTVYQITDEDGNKSYYIVGDDPSGIPVISLVQNGEMGTESSVPWSTTGGTASASNPLTSEVAVSGDSGSTQPSYDQGDQGVTSDDSGNLEKIASNTAAIASNQEKQGQQLAAMANKQDGTNALLGEISQKLDNQRSVVINGGEYTGPTADEIATAIDDKLSDTGGQSYSDPGVASDSSYNQALSDIGTEASLNDAPDDYKQKKDIDSSLDQVLSDSGLQSHKNAIENSGVECIGDCQISWDYNGHSISFTICDFQPQLALWGVVMQSLAGLTGILIIFRRN